METSSSAPQKVRRIMSSLPKRMRASSASDDLPTSDMCPQDYLVSLLESKGDAVRISSSLAMEGFFADYTEDETNAYDHDVLTAIRTRDIEKLRKFHESGRPLKCSNNFGESLLHLACRRGFVDVASFLMSEAGVTVRVIDDYGRTPLHDACWTCEPNFELLELLMTECPDLLFMRDRRGNTPLQYVQQYHWGSYVQFLRKRQDLLRTHSETELKQ